MPSLNMRGQAAHGTGGNLVSLDNVMFDSGGEVSWLDEQNILYQRHVLSDDTWHLAVYDTQHGQITRLVNAPSHPFYSKGANFVTASGNGEWVAWLGGFGLFTSYGLHLPHAGVAVMGPDGGLSYKPNYHSSGPQILMRLDGSQFDLSVSSCSDLQLLGGDKAIWREGNKIHVHDLPPCIQVGSIWKPRALFVNGEWWVCYYSAQAGVVLHPFASTVGYQIVPTGQDAWHDAVYLGANAVRVTYSTGIAELPGEVFSVDVNLSSIRKELNVAPVVRVPAINRPLWLAFFEFAEGPPSPGNAMLAVRNISGEKRTRPVIVTGETVNRVTGTTLGYFVSGDPINIIEDKAARVAAIYDLPVYAYWDDRNWPRWPGVRNEDVVCIQAYRWADESLEKYEQDLVRIINSAPPDMQLALVPSCYASNSRVHKDLASVVPVMAKLAREHHNIKAILPFSGYGRATGLQDHPELRPLWQSVADSITVPEIVHLTKPMEEPQMQPYNEQLVQQAEDEIIRQYAEARRPPDAARGAVWIARMVYDYCAGMSWRDSQDKHIRALRRELQLDAPSEVP